MKFIKSVFSLGAVIMATRVFGFLRSIIQASLVGISEISDVLNGSVRLPSYIRRYITEGGISSVFIPIYSSIEDKKKASEFAGCIFNIFIVICSILFILFQIYAHEFMGIIFGGWMGTEKFLLVVWASRFLITMSLFHIVYSIYASILNAHEQFFIVGKAWLYQNISIVFLLLVFFYVNLWSDFFSSHIVGTYILVFELGTVISTVYMIYMSKIYKISPILLLPLESYRKNIKYIKQFFIRIVPNVLSAGSAYINMTISLAAASRMPGIVSCLAYADRIQQLPISILGAVVGNIMLSLLSNSRESEGSKSIVRAGIVYSALIGFYCAVFTYIASYAMVFYSLSGPKFSLDAVTTTSNIVSIYSIALPAFIMIKLLNAQAFSKGLSFFPFFSSICGIICEIFIISNYTDIYGYKAISYALVVAVWVNLIVLSTMIYIKDKDLREFVSKFISNILIMSIFAISSVVCINYIFGSIHDSIIKLVYSSIVSLIIFLPSILILRG